MSEVSNNTGQSSGGPPQAASGPAGQGIDLNKLLVWGIALVLPLLFIAWGPFWSLLKLFVGEEEYSHGLVVIPLTVYFIWMQRDKLAKLDTGPSWSWLEVLLLEIAAVGLAVAFLSVAYTLLINRSLSTENPWPIGLIIGGLLCQIPAWVHFSRRELSASIRKEALTCKVGLMFLQLGILLAVVSVLSPSPLRSNLGLILMAMGLVMVLYGWKRFRLMAMPMVYLFFMLPMPNDFRSKLARPLQLLASDAGTLLLRITDVPVYRSGSIIQLSAGHTLEVGEACSGINFLMGFLALGFVFSYLSRRPLWFKAVLFASTIPIAVLVNVVRVAGTGLIYEYLTPQLAQDFMHILEGYVMFVVGLIFFFIERQILLFLADQLELDVSVKKEEEPEGEHATKAPRWKNTSRAAKERLLLYVLFAATILSARYMGWLAAQEATGQDGQLGRSDWSHLIGSPRLWGFIIFAITIELIAGLLRWRKARRKRTNGSLAHREEAEGNETNTFFASMMPKFMLCAVMLYAGAGGYQSATLRGVDTDALPLARDLDSISLIQGRWLGSEIEIAPSVIRIANATSSIKRQYSFGPQTDCTVYIAYYGAPHDDVPHVPNDCYTIAGWGLRKEQKAEIPVAGGTILANQILFEKDGEQLAVQHFYIDTGEPVWTVKKWKYAGKLLFGERCYVIQVQTAAKVWTTPEQALERNELIVQALWPELSKCLPVIDKTEGTDQ